MGAWCQLFFDFLCWKMRQSVWTLLSPKIVATSTSTVTQPRSRSKNGTHSMNVQHVYSQVVRSQVHRLEDLL